MQKTSKDLTTKSEFAVNERLLYQPAWAWSRNNPRAYGRVVYFSHYMADAQKAVVKLDGLFYKVNLSDLGPVPENWPDTNESTLFYLLQKNEDLKKEVNALAAICCFIAAVILIILMFRGV